MEKINYYLIKFEAYLLTQRRLAKNTLSSYISDIRHFQDFLNQKKIEIDKTEIKDIKDYLAYLKKLELLPRSMARRISSLKVFYNFLESEGYANLANNLTFPKIDKRLPNFLTDQEVDNLFKKAKEDASQTGEQVYICLMLLYATGLRVSELVGLKVCDVQFDTGLIRVHGKGGKGRLVPVPINILNMLKKYIDELFVKITENKPSANHPFFAQKRNGQVCQYTRQWVWTKLKDLAQKAGIKRTLSPHVLRHSLATHLLKNGADLRTLQMLLGHENVKTVEIYTHLDTDHLRKLYDKKHPRA